MGQWLDIFSLILTTILFVGTIIGVVLLVKKISDGITSTKQSLKEKGWTVSREGVSVKTSRRFDREDYIDATQRGIMKAMNASHYGANTPGSASTSPRVPPKTPDLNHNASAASLKTNGSGSSEGSNGEKEKRRGLLHRRAK